MTDTKTVERYLLEFERWVPGEPHDRAELVRELETHLREARSAGRLHEALAQFGSPRDAAATFSRGRSWISAPLSARWRAAAIDYAPLVIAAVALTIWQFVTRPDNSFSFGVFSFPATITVDSDRSLGQNLFWNIVAVSATLWSFLGLGLLESRTGRTPGKRILGLATISEDSTSVSLHQTLVRRIPLWFGPLFWLDLITLATSRRQRVFEMLARTRVVQSPARLVTAGDAS